jgi:hypothetical protein
MKSISPAALVALKDALTHIYWRKQDLRSFLEAALGGPELVSRLDWSATKRECVHALVTHLARHETTEQEALLRLMLACAEVDDFSHLEREDDAPVKIANAQRAVAALNKHVEGYAELRAERERADERRRISQEMSSRQQATDAALAQVHSDFIEMTRQAAQDRGYSFERLLTELFGIFDMDPRASFRIKGEQIDGHFAFDGIDFLVEAKWQNELVGVQSLDAFKGKIDRKLDNTLGLYWSYNGFSPDAVERHSMSRPAMILADGTDLMAVLERRIRLDELLRRKRRHAAQTGEILFRARQMLGD